MRILMTGATGYLGSSLMNALLENPENEVHALVRSQPKGHDSRVMYHHYDGTYSSVAECFSAHSFDVVIHIAALAVYDTTPDNIAPLIDANLQFGTFLLQAMSEFGCRKLINTGTYWQHYNGTEQYNPVSLYAAMKEAFEALVEYYVQAHHFKVITLKLTDVYGPQDPRKKLLNYLIESMGRKEPVTLTQCEQLINLVYIDDAVDAYIKSLEHLERTKKQCHEKYFVAGAETYPLKKIIQLLLSQSKSELVIAYDKPYRAREVMVPYIGDVLPGWSPSISIEQGIQNMLNAHGQ